MGSISQASMAEPASQDTPKDSESKRGMPYYDKLRQELRESINKKRILDRSLASLEDSIYRFEGSYLEETTAGNIIKGFDNYIKSSSSTSNILNKKKGTVSDQDRVFSRSSASFIREMSPLSSQSTPRAGTPTSNFSGSGLTNKKKNKKSERDDDDSDAKQPKRLKITYSRE